MGSYATGIRRIFEDYEGFEKQPYFNISDNGVIVTFYNMNYEAKLNTSENFDNKNEGKNEGKKKLSPKQRRNEILKYMSDNPKITKNELSEKLYVSISTIERDFVKLKDNGYIHREGSKTDGQWIIDRV